MHLNRIKSQSEDNIPLLHNFSEDKNASNHKISRSDVLVRNDDWAIYESNEYVLSSDIHIKGEINDCQGIIHIIKCSIGTGILGLPSALRYSGYAMGVSAIFIMSLINIYAMHLLLEVVEYLRATYPKNIKNLDYEKTVRLCFELSPERLRKYSWMHLALLGCLCLAQIGFLSSYHIFVADNTKKLVDYYVEEKFHFAIWTYQLVYFFLLTPLLFFRNLNVLSYLCQLANVFIAFSLITSIIYCLIDPLPIGELQPIKISNSTFLFFGIILFSFESINVLNPIENNLKNKKNMTKVFGILNLACCFVLPASLVVGFTGYWKFGDNISTSLILSIPVQPWYLMLVKPLYIISIFISYSLQGFVLVDIILNRVINKIKSKPKQKIADFSSRVGIGLAVTILSISIPQFDLLLSLIGAFTGSGVALIFPSICHSVMVYTMKKGRFWKIRLFADIMLLIFGICGCVLGTYTSILNINKAFNP